MKQENNDVILGLEFGEQNETTSEVFKTTAPSIPGLQTLLAPFSEIKVFEMMSQSEHQA